MQLQIGFHFKALGDAAIAVRAFQPHIKAPQAAHMLEHFLRTAFIQRTAMSERSRMRDVAERVIDGSLRP